MPELRKVLNDSAEMNDNHFKEMIFQKSLFPDVYDSDTHFASDLDDEEEEEEEFEEEDEDIFDEDELEEEGYEEDFDFDEEEKEEDEEEDLGKYN
jgi:hypothetical protein